MGALGRRLGFYALTAWIAITINFLLPRLMPGDPVSIMFASFEGRLSAEAMTALREAYGFSDQSLLQQYVGYLGQVATGELGVSIAFFPARVTDVMAGGLVWTLVLAATSILISFALGSALGVLVAWRRDSWLDSLLPPTLSLIGAFPYFWLAMLGLHVFSLRLEWFPMRHAYRSELAPGFDPTFIASAMYHAALPALTLVVASIGGWTLGMRSAMINVLGTDYVTMAQAKGLSTGRVVFLYAARNALLPSITQFGMALGFVLGGALLTEMVFGYPGQGYLLLQAVRAQDYPLMQGIFLSITLTVLIANWLVDVAYFWLDPVARRA